MYLQELNSIRKTQFDLENLIKQRARANPSFLSEIKFLFERITLDVLQLQSSMLERFRELEIQVSTFGCFLSNKLEISEKLSDLSAFQAQFNIILEIQADIEIHLRKKRWYKNTIDLVVRIPGITGQTNSVPFAEKSARKAKRKIDREEPTSLPQDIINTSVDIEQTNSHSNCPVSMGELDLAASESSLPQSGSLTQDTILLNTQDNSVQPHSDTILDNPLLFSQDSIPYTSLDLSQTLPISSLSINQTQDNFASLLFDCSDIFPVKPQNAPLVDSQATTDGTNSPVIGEKHNHASVIAQEILSQEQTQSQEIILHDLTSGQEANHGVSNKNKEHCISKNLVFTALHQEPVSADYPNMKTSSNTINLDSHVELFSKKHCKQTNFKMNFAGSFKESESLQKSFLCGQISEKPKQTSFWNFSFPKKQRSILNYVSPPRNNTHDVGNDLTLTEVHLNSSTDSSTLKHHGHTETNHANNKNITTINSRPFYRLNLLMVNREEITNDFPVMMWNSESFPAEVLAQLELDLNFW